MKNVLKNEHFNAIMALLRTICSIGGFLIATAALVK